MRRQELERLSSHDALTGLPNRNEFLRRLTEAIDAARLQGTTGCMWRCSISTVSRSSTRRSGSRRATSCSARSVGGSRASRRAVRPGTRADGRGPWTALIRSPERVRHARRADRRWLARLPGDEFALMMHGIGDTHAAEALTQAVMQALRRVCQVAGIECFLSASAGLASFPARCRCGGHPAVARRPGHPRGQGARAQRRWLVPALAGTGWPRAHRDGDRPAQGDRAEEFELHFQPWVDVPAARVTGLEALVRWRREGQARAARRFHTAGRGHRA
jgi:predicted signal transduction protein with EAL and GGDEF domain